MWKTNKWVPEWVIRPAIAHLHGPSILAGVQEQNIWTESLLPHPPPLPHHGELQVEANQNSPALHWATQSYNPTWANLLVTSPWLLSGIDAIPPSPRVPSKCAWWHLLALLLLDCATPSFGLSSSCASLVFHGPRTLQPRELCKCFQSFWNTFSVAILVSLAFWFVSFTALFTRASII